MRSITQKYPFRRQAITLLTFLLVFLFGAVLTSTVQAATTAKPPTPRAGEHLVTIHDDGKDKGILTKATTLRDAFKVSGIHTDPNDLVEPSLDEELVATNYEVNIYRARPITIVDGSVRTKIMSAYQTPRQITDHAGMKLQDEDTTVMTANTDIVGEGAGMQLTIKRATPFTLVLYGKKTTAYTQTKTVADMLKEKKISLGKDDTLSIPQTAPITMGMTIELWRNGKQTVTEEQDVGFDTEQIKDADQPVGYKKVQTPGENGKKTVTYEIEMKNGIEVGRNEILSVVSKAPKKQVEVVGTKHTLPPGSHTDWMAAAGIPASDYGNVNLIMTGESHWNPAAVSPNGYYGMGQTNLAAISSACPNWESDPICQLGFFTGYANRYGGWTGAADFWSGHHWW